MRVAALVPETVYVTPWHGRNDCKMAVLNHRGVVLARAEAFVFTDCIAWHVYSPKTRRWSEWSHVESLELGRSQAFVAALRLAS